MTPTKRDEMPELKPDEIRPSVRDAVRNLAKPVWLKAPLQRTIEQDDDVVAFHRNPTEEIISEMVYQFNRKWSSSDPKNNTQIHKHQAEQIYRDLMWLAGRTVILEEAQKPDLPAPADGELREAYAAIRELADRYSKLWHRIAYQRRMGLAHQDDNKLLEDTRLPNGVSSTIERAKQALEKHAAAIGKAGKS